MEYIPFNIIGRIRSDFPAKFGIPRQSGVVDSLSAKIIFEPEYRNTDALRGLDGYSHLWLLWHFSQVRHSKWQPTVRPPKLGGNTRMGVFATRSPYRPNPIGLSCVRLDKIEPNTPNGPILYISGADLLDGTPILDIKPYIPYTDAHPDALSGFAQDGKEKLLGVNIPDALLNKIPAEKQSALIGILEQDPRPGYQNDSKRIYKLNFAGFDIHFTVSDNIVNVCDVILL